MQPFIRKFNNTKKAVFVNCIHADNLIESWKVDMTRMKRVLEVRMQLLLEDYRRTIHNNARIESYECKQRWL